MRRRKKEVANQRNTVLPNIREPDMGGFALEEGDGQQGDEEDYGLPGGDHTQVDSGDEICSNGACPFVPRDSRL